MASCPWQNSAKSYPALKSHNAYKKRAYFQCAIEFCPILYNYETDLLQSKQVGALEPLNPKWQTCATNMSLSVLFMAGGRQWCYAFAHFTGCPGFAAKDCRAIFPWDSWF